MDWGLINGVLFLDLKKAFDTVVACVAGRIRGHEKLEIPPAQKLHILSSPGSWVPEHSDWSERWFWIFDWQE
jgi:hypothetical protein